VEGRIQAEGRIQVERHSLAARRILEVAHIPVEVRCLAVAARNQVGVSRLWEVVAAVVAKQMREVLLSALPRAAAVVAAGVAFGQTRSC
jgi:hypothetical protein